MIAYHYPPIRGSSGVQRTLKFTRYLADHGWEPIVLTVHPRAYPQVGNDQMHEIPEHITVKRVFALDTARHLSLNGAYPSFLAWPDRWANWWLGAVPTGLELIRRLKPTAIWSTYPIATAHLIGLSLARLTGLRWVADFRDSMTEAGHPADPATWRIFRWIEARTVTRARRVIMTTPGTMRMYAQRYPQLPASHWRVIANGYDEENFSAAQKINRARTDPDTPVTLVHSGLLYPSERDPTALFSALAAMKREGETSAEQLQITLRATGDDRRYQRMIENHKLHNIVCLKPAIGYEEALAEMLAADGLLVLQASNCNHQIPAKVYEYLRAQRPILALTDSSGDTAELLKACGIETQVSLTDAHAIRDELRRFINMIHAGTAPRACEEIVTRYSRRAQAAELAQVLGALD